MKKKNFFGLVARKGMSGYLFILPFIIGFLFILMPALIESLIYSFNKVTIGFGGIEREFIGWKNYYDAFYTDAAFVPLLITLGQTMFVDIIVVIVFSFFISNVLNQKFLGRGAVRMVFFLPVILTTGIVAMMAAENVELGSLGVIDEVGSSFDSLGWGAMFDTMSMMYKLSIPASIGDFIMRSIFNTSSIVNSSGVQILIFLSALQSISPSLFEAAKVEGATKWEEFWKITFPMLTPMILVAIVYSVIDTFTNPKYGIMDFIYSKSFGSGAMGFGSALSWIYFAIVAVVLVVVTGIISKRVSYLD